MTPFYKWLSIYLSVLTLLLFPISVTKVKFIVPTLIVTKTDTSTKEEKKPEPVALAQVHEPIQPEMAVRTFDDEFRNQSKRYSLMYLIQTNHYLDLGVVSQNTIFGSSEGFQDFLSSLDKYSQYFSAERTAFNQHRGKLKRIGIGADLLIHKDRVLLYPIKGGALYNAGLIKPVYLVSVNNQCIDYKNFATYRFMNEWKVGNSVTVKVLNDFEEVQTYKVSVSNYVQKLAIRTEIAKHKALQIREFRKSTYHSVNTFLNRLSKGEDFILDFRYGNGGDLYAAIETLGLFLSKDTTAAWLTKSRSGELPLDVEGKNKHQWTKIYILTSQFTASAAEIFIRALRTKLPEYVVVIGDRTSGKCLAQYTYKLQDGASLMLSAFEVLTADGFSCENEPINPDIHIDNIETMDITTENLMKYSSSQNEEAP